MSGDDIHITALHKQVELRFGGYEPRIYIKPEGIGILLTIAVDLSEAGVWARSKLIEPASGEGLGYAVFIGTYDLMDELDVLIKDRVA